MTTVVPLKDEYNVNEETKESNVSGDQEYQLQPMRKWVLAAFAFSAMSVSNCMMVFASISTLVAPVYETDTNTVSLTIVAFTISFLTLSFFTIPLLEKSMSMTLRACAIIVVVGSWIRWILLKNNSFSGLIAAQFFIAIPYPFFQNAPAKLATIWFGDKERALATAIGALATISGLVLGLSMGPIFVNLTLCPRIKADDSTYDYTTCVSANQQELKESITDYLLIQAILTTVLNSGLIYIMSEGPITYPSFAAEQMSKMKGKLNMKNDFMLLIKNKNYLIIGGAFTFSYSIQVALGATLPLITVPYGYTNAEGGLFAIFFILSGIVASGVFSAYLDRTGKPKILYVGLMFGSVTAFLALDALLLLGSDTTKTPITKPPLWIALILISLAGVMVLPLIPVGFSFIVEATYPVSEVMSIGLTAFFGQLMGLTVIFVCQSICTEKVGENDVLKGGATIILTVVLVIGAILTTLTKEDLRKSAASKVGASEIA